jgi:glycosyltransferase involved in cell wall biosynthesis
MVTVTGETTIMSITRQEPDSAVLAGTADADGLLREAAYYGGDKSPSTTRRLGPLRELIDDRPLDALLEGTMRPEHVPARKIAVIHNGLPDEAFAPRPPARIDTVSPVLVWIANLKLRKGHQHLLEAVGLLQAAGQPCRLVPAGDGDRQDAFAGQARRVGTDVRFLGAQPDVGQLLTRADAVILPSLQEGVSNAVMEATAAGPPTVTSVVGGKPELLHGRGVLVPPGDPAALGSAVRGLLAEPTRGAALGAAAHHWSRAHLSADAMVEEHVRIYSELLGRRCAA